MFLSVRGSNAVTLYLDFLRTQLELILSQLCRAGAGQDCCCWYPRLADLNLGALLWVCGVSVAFTSSWGFVSFHLVLSLSPRNLLFGRVCWGKASPLRNTHLKPDAPLAPTNSSGSAVPGKWGSVLASRKQCPGSSPRFVDVQILDGTQPFEAKFILGSQSSEIKGRPLRAAQIRGCHGEAIKYSRKKTAGDWRSTAQRCSPGQWVDAGI